VSTPSLDAVKAIQSKFKPSSTGYQEIQAGIEDYNTQSEALKKKAEKAATALEAKGAYTSQTMKNIEAIQAQAALDKTSTGQMWSQAAEKAGEYVEATKLRTTQVLQDVDRIFEELNQGRNFEKAHAMQAGVQSTLGAMAEEERAIRQSAKSPEDLEKKLQQFNQKKTTALGKMQSELEVGYANITEEANQNYLKARTDAAVEMNMYTGFQEQQHVETLMGLAKSSEAYALSESQFQLAAEQLKMSGMTELSEWITNTPEFVMELAPLMAVASNVYQRELAAAQTAKQGTQYWTPGSEYVNVSMPTAAYLKAPTPPPGYQLAPGYQVREGVGTGGLTYSYAGGGK
jgi:hypothetical protein